MGDGGMGDGDGRPFSDVAEYIQNIVFFPSSLLGVAP